MATGKAKTGVRRYHCTDVGNAAFFRDFTNGNLVFNYRAQTWYEWNGRKWQPCLNGEIQEWAKKASREMLKHSATINDKEKRRDYAMWALKSESESKIRAMLNLARSEPGIMDSGEHWDADPFQLGCPSGILDLKSGNFIPPDKKIKILSSISIDPNDKAKCDSWRQFLEDIYEGDQELIAFLKRMFGYSLTGSIKEQCIVCFYGQGANGKSTLTTTLLELFGTYGYTMPFQTIQHRRLPSGDSPSSDVAELLGKRFVVASETQESVRLNEGRLKSLTGGDFIRARFLYKEGFAFKPTAHIFLAFNHKPIITDDSEGAWRRIHLVAHNRIFKRHEQNKELPEILSKELPGILNWMIEGCLEWQKSGLLVPQSVIDSTQEYRAEMNPLREFIEDDCEVGNFHVRVGDLWEAYNQWADANRVRFRLGRQSFNNRLESMGFTRKTVRFATDKTDKCWIGLGLAVNPQKNSLFKVDVVN